MSEALEGNHYCPAHQGNHALYAVKNCDLCRAEAKLAKVRAMVDSAKARGYTHPILDELTAIFEERTS